MILFVSFWENVCLLFNLCIVGFLLRWSCYVVRCGNFLRIILLFICCFFGCSFGWVLMWSLVVSLVVEVGLVWYCWNSMVVVRLVFFCVMWLSRSCWLWECWYLFIGLLIGRVGCWLIDLVVKCRKSVICCWFVGVKVIFVLVWVSWILVLILFWLRFWCNVMRLVGCWMGRRCGLLMCSICSLWLCLCVLVRNRWCVMRVCCSLLLILVC